MAEKSQVPFPCGSSPSGLLQTEHPGHSLGSCKLPFQSHQGGSVDLFWTGNSLPPCSMSPGNAFLPVWEVNSRFYKHWIWPLKYDNFKKFSKIQGLGTGGGAGVPYRGEEWWVSSNSFLAVSLGTIGSRICQFWSAQIRKECGIWKRGSL